MKALTRRKLRRLREEIPAEVRAAAHETMAAHLRELIASVRRTTDCAEDVIALYAAGPDEADPRGLIALEPNLLFAWPRVVGNELELVVCPEDRLAPGHRGILEPPAAIPAIPLERVRLVVVPGLAFDPSGHRLGQGGGHYDRLLERWRKLQRPPHEGLTVGLAYALQIVPEVPREPHDQHVDVIVTEHGILRPQRA